MSDTIIAALIKFLVGLIGVVVGIFKTQIIGIFQKSKRNVSGYWTGEAFDVEVPGIIEYEVKRNYKIKVGLKQVERTITGKAIIDNGDSDTTHSFIGKMVSEELLELQYKMNIEGSIHSGNLMFRVNGMANKPDGYFMAKRALEIGHEFGAINLLKNT